MQDPEAWDLRSCRDPHLDVAGQLAMTVADQPARAGFSSAEIGPQGRDAGPPVDG